jgi:hypothetical protein
MSYCVDDNADQPNIRVLTLRSLIFHFDAFKCRSVLTLASNWPLLIGFQEEPCAGTCVHVHLRFAELELHDSFSVSM